jgi:hypothetical protein
MIMTRTRMIRNYDDKRAPPSLRTVSAYFSFEIARGVLRVRIRVCGLSSGLQVAGTRDQPETAQDRALARPGLL